MYVENIINRNNKSKFKVSKHFINHLLSVKLLELLNETKMLLFIEMKIFLNHFSTKIVFHQNLKKNFFILQQFFVARPLCMKQVL